MAVQNFDSTLHPLPDQHKSQHDISAPASNSELEAMASRVTTCSLSKLHTSKGTGFISAQSVMGTGVPQKRRNKVLKPMMARSSSLLSSKIINKSLPTPAKHKNYEPKKVEMKERKEEKEVAENQSTEPKAERTDARPGTIELGEANLEQLTFQQCPSDSRVTYCQSSSHIVLRIHLPARAILVGAAADCGAIGNPVTTFRSNLADVRVAVQRRQRLCIGAKYYVPGQTTDTTTAKSTCKQEAVPPIPPLISGNIPSLLPDSASCSSSALPTSTSLVPKRLVLARTLAGNATLAAAEQGQPECQRWKFVKSTSEKPSQSVASRTATSTAIPIPEVDRSSLPYLEFKLLKMRDPDLCQDHKQSHSSEATQTPTLSGIKVTGRLDKVKAEGTSAGVWYALFLEDTPGHIPAISSSDSETDSE
jgi:hypothetical protein